MRSGDLPAVIGCLMEVSGYVPARFVPAVELYVHDHRTLRPSQRLCRPGSRPGEVGVGAVKIYPVMCYVSVVVAMEGNLNVMPGVCRPFPRVAGDIGGVPVRTFAVVVAPFPGVGIRRALCAVDDGPAIRH